ncbi:xylosyltransferase 1-like, partial [Trifolium medium]|nr:xylosyltransferase 1-like [Trifolium medium]
ILGSFSSAGGGEELPLVDVISFKGSEDSGGLFVESDLE